MPALTLISFSFLIVTNFRKISSPNCSNEVPLVGQ
jgi:hypothetical protein